MKILVVDDHQYNRDLLGFILEDHGYLFCEAKNGKEAVQMVGADEKIGLVLMDVNMPVLDGYQATEQIKKNYADRFIPIVFVTALDDEETLARCLAVGGEDFVPKPVNENVLMAKIKAHQRTVTFYQALETTNRSLSYHQKLMAREHAIVEHVFQNGMKRVTRDCANVRFEVSPLSMFNGDLLLISPSPSGSVYILLGDFTGHGLSAAIGCLPVMDIFYAMTQKQVSIGEIAAEINSRLQELLPSNMFFCAAIVELSAHGDRLSYWVGGMNDLLVIGEEGGIEQVIEAQHMPLGILDETEFDDHVGVLHVPPHSKLLMYTDGVIEAVNHEGEFFGEERLRALVAASEESYVESVTNAVHAFQSGAEQTDDMSIAELVCAPVVSTAGKSYQRPKLEAVLPWHIALELSAEHLKRGDLLSRLMRLLRSEPQLESHIDVIFMICSELYNNALDHGVLQLDSLSKVNQEGFEAFYQERAKRLDDLTSGSVILDLRLTAGPALEICVRDSGLGFDYERFLSSGYSGPDLAYGRGIQLVQSLCRTLEYSDEGRCVKVAYDLV